MDRDWAIIVGVKHYLDPTLNTLEGPVGDADRFYEWLIAPDGGNLKPAVIADEDHPNRIKIVKSTRNPTLPSDARPTSDDVWAAGEDIIDWLVKHPDVSGRRLYIYMSGHGCTPNTAELAENVALLMANARVSSCALVFPASACARYMRRKAYFEEVILIMDCCRGLANACCAPYYSLEASNTTRKGHIVEAYATGWNSQAHEFPYPPFASKRGVFTQALLACLKSGRLNGSQLKESIAVIVENDLLSRGLSQEQTRDRKPLIRADPPEFLNEIWFSEEATPACTRVKVRRTFGMPNPKIFQCVRYPPLLMEAENPTDPWSWVLEPGNYKLEVGTTEKDFTVYASLPLELEP